METSNRRMPEVWKPAHSGKLKVKHWKRIQHTQTPSCELLSHIWAKFVPLKISVCAWKMYWNGLPTEDNFQKINVAIASRCGCYLTPQSESLHHLVLASDLANEI